MNKLKIIVKKFRGVEKNMSEIRIIPLGGMREIGKNAYVIEVDKEIYLLDCGIQYPSGSQFGIDTVIPDFSYIESNADKLAGVFLSHGHEDAIGSLPYFLDKFDVPVFGSALTIELAKFTIEKTGYATEFDDFHVVDEQTQINFENASVHFFNTTHTIPGSLGTVIKTDEGNIVYTGDFKFDQSAPRNYRTDFGEIAAIGQEGVLALLSDSTNSESAYENLSELRVQETIDEDFDNTDSRIIISAVASNILRIQQVFEATRNADRYVFMSGKEVEEILKITADLELIDLPEDLIKPIEQIEEYDDNQIVILAAFGPGESIYSINKMTEGQDPYVQIRENDLVYVVTSPTNDMELDMSDMMNKVYGKGATVSNLTDNIFATGHATPTELKLLINLLKPKYVVPVQGDYSMLSLHAELASELDIPTQNIYILKNGDVLTYNDGDMSTSGQIQTGSVMIDGSGIGDIGNIVMRDRHILSEDGVFVVAVTINRREKKIISKPKVVTRGFIFVKESTDLIEESISIVSKAVNSELQNNNFDWNTLKQAIRDDLGKFLNKKTARRPIILPVIMEVRHR